MRDIFVISIANIFSILKAAAGGRETNFKNSQIAGSAIKNNDKRDIFRRDCRFVKKSNVAIKNLFFGSQGIRKFFDICKSCREKFLQYVVHYTYIIFLLSFYLQHLTNHHSLIHTYIYFFPKIF